MSLTRVQTQLPGSCAPPIHWAQGGIKLTEIANMEENTGQTRKVNCRVHVWTVNNNLDEYVIVPEYLFKLYLNYFQLGSRLLKNDLQLS